MRKVWMKAPVLMRWMVVLAVPALTVCLLGCGSEPAGGSSVNSWLGLDLKQMISDTDTVGRICLALLLVFSVCTWAIIIYKFLHIQIASRQTSRFVRECMSGSGDLEEAYRNASSYPDSPLAQILREGYLELEIEDWYQMGYDLSPEQRVEVAKAGVERVFERTISNEIAHLESYLIVLAVASSVCPFIGLFGTVWGIMATFQAMGTQSSPSLSGIATALVTTVAGLAAAIPASVMYNYFTSRVQLLISRMDSFSLELANIIQKQLLKQNL